MKTNCSTCRHQPDGEGPQGISVYIARPLECDSGSRWVSNCKWPTGVEESIVVLYYGDSEDEINCPTWEPKKA